MHYNCQSEEDLKKIYDKVMNANLLDEKWTDYNSTGGGCSFSYYIYNISGAQMLIDNILLVLYWGFIHRY